MTEVTFFQKETGELTGFRIENHAGFDDEGKDIAINTINSINELTSDTMDVDMDEDEAYIDASIFDTPCKEAQLLLKSLALGLENLEDDEAVNNFIDVIFEEV